MTQFIKTPTAHQDSPASLQDELFALWQLLGMQWRKRFGGLIILSLFASMCEVLSVGSLLPFLAVLTMPEQLLQWPIMGYWLSSLNIRTDQAIIITFGLIFGVMVLVASLVRWWLSSSCIRYSYQVGGVIGQEIFRRVLLQPYSFHLHNTSSEITDVITTRVQIVVNSVIIAGLQLITSSVMVVVIGVVLLWIDPILAATAFIGFALVYVVIYQLSRRRLKTNSARMSQVSTKRYQLLQESLGGIRDIKIDGSHRYFTQSFQAIDDVFRSSQSQNAIISTSPRYLAEGLGTLLLAALAVFYATQTADANLTTSGSRINTLTFTNLVPMLGVLVMATQRILPMLQKIYAGWTSIRGVNHTLSLVRKWLQTPLPINVPLLASAPLTPNSTSNSEELISTIELRQVSFKYQTEFPPVIKDLNLTIRKGQTIGFVGTTGAGKSTLLDILMGLLEPTSGQLLIDNKPLEISGKNTLFTDNWRRQIAHVPQHIFLADTSIANNVAFGLPPDAIDYNRLVQAIEQAQLTELVQALPDGLNTLIGERGVRLSGGQRQRIGIARALYKNARVLILDEATSALDPITEEAITQSLARLSKALTIVIVSHRPSALKYCDVVYNLELGQLFNST